MCQIGRDFNAGKPVDSLTPIVCSSEYVGGGANVLDGQILVDLYRWTACSAGSADALVVIMAVDDSLLEDAGIGCYAADTILLDQAQERAGVDEITTERVEPDTLTALFECVEWIACHHFLSFMRFTTLSDGLHSVITAAGKRNAYRLGQPLPQRPGCCLDSGKRAVVRMAL
jgi:hypothetical protein